MVDMNNIEQFVEQLKAPEQDTNKTYTAVVSRKDNSGIVWVYLAGSNTETPTASTSSEVESGDVVNVEWRNNKLFIVGNSTNPSAGIIRVQAVEHATEVANQAASNAVQSAGQAREAADNAIASAGQARTAAAEATETAATAGRAASAAQAAADAAQETANSKKTVFVTEPTPPYHVGDLWVRFDPEVFDMVDSDGNSLIDDQGDLFEAAILKEAAAYVCMVPKLAGQAFDESDFELATADNGLREWFWHDANGAHILGDVTGFRNDLTSTGMKIVDTSTETSVAQFGSSGARIGKTDQSHVDIQSEGIKFYGGNNNVVANIGYDDVNDCYYYTFGERDDNYSVGEDSFAEGHSVAAIGKYSHAEGEDTSAEGQADHAEGFGTVASGDYSHAEGIETVASYTSAHAEGNGCVASGDASHAQNLATLAASEHQTALGKYNEEDDQDTYAVIIGNGTANDARSNALTVDWSGNVETAGDITDGSLNKLSDKIESSDILPLFDVVSVNKTFTVSANSTQNQSFAPAAADVPSGYTRVGLCGWNTANGNVFIVTCTGTTITFGNKSSSQVTCNNAQVDWLYIRSSI